MHSDKVKVETADILRCHYNSSVIFTDAICLDKPERELRENELRAGELSAVVFRVGYYMVRSALRIYKLVYDADCDRETEVPADKEEVEAVKKGGFGKDFHKMFAREIYFENVDTATFSLWKDGLLVYHEISARHCEKPSNECIYVCRAAQSMSPDWCEYIGDIYTVKADDLIPDADASLIVYSHYESSSFGMDTWHKLDPNGNLKEFRIDDKYIYM